MPPDMSVPIERAEELRRLHHENLPLVLPNAWDVASARVFAAHPRCRALATTSAGMAASLGYPDGELIPPAEMLAAIGRIARAVSIPVTADLEAGYADTPEGVADTVRQVIDYGAAGCNLEDATRDGLLEPSRAVERVRAARQAADAAGVPLVLNARTDVFLRQVGEPARRLAHAVTRLTAYRDAGADCLFAPGVTDRRTIAELVAAVGAPLNVLATPDALPVAELRELGVARISVGSGPMRATLAYTGRFAGELLDRGDYRGLAGAPSLAELATLLGGG